MVLGITADTRKDKKQNGLMKTAQRLQMETVKSQLDLGLPTLNDNRFRHRNKIKIKGKQK